MLRYELYDLPERKRTDETQKAYADAFRAKLNAVRLRSFDLAFSGAGSPVVGAVVSRIGALAPQILSETKSKEASAALAAFADASGKLSVSAYSRLEPEVSDLLGKNAKDVLESFAFTFKNSPRVRFLLPSWSRRW